MNKLASRIIADLESRVVELEAAEAQLTALRGGLERLVQKWREGNDYIYCCLADELQSLLTQTTTTVNSQDRN